jgi:hypothetical protein
VADGARTRARARGHGREASVVAVHVDQMR